jgi:hypothetical protein
MTSTICGNPLLIPRVTDMRNGTFRPEIVIDTPGTGGDIVFMDPVDSVAEARLRAHAAVQAAAEALAA